MARHSEPVGVHTVTIPQAGMDAGKESPNKAVDFLRHRTHVRSKSPAQVRTPVTPTRLHTSEGDSLSPRAPNRERVNSREYAHSYEGNYGSPDDMVGPIVAQNAGGWWEKHQKYMFAAYLLVLWLAGVVVAMVMSSAGAALANKTFTVLNVLHFAVTLNYLHWMKGGCAENYGELEHMTLWEQIEAAPHTMWLRFGLRLVPTCLCWFACIQAEWEFYESAFNAVVWLLTLLGKFAFMNGYRIFGINAHPSIGKAE